MRATVLVGLFVLIACGLLVLAQEGQPPSPHEQVVRDTLAGFEQLTATLASIQDTDTAAASRPELKKVVGLLVEARKKAESLPQPPREEKERIARTYQRKLTEAMDKFRSEERRVQGIPAGAEALKELAPLRAKQEKQGK